MSDGNKKGVIVIVDDNPTNLGVLFDFLTDSGFRVLVAQDGESAIQKVEYARPDLILLDVMMPGIDGFETCRRLKAKDSTKDIPVIFMTALSDTQDKINGFNLGAVDYVTKPVQQEEVKARVITHLTIRNLQKELQAQNLQLQQEITEKQKVEDSLRNLQKELQAQNLQLQQEITEKQKVEDSLRNLQKELQEQNSQLQQEIEEKQKVEESLQQEIEEKQKVEESLREAEEKYRGIFENASEGIFQATPDGRYITANVALARIFGYSNAEELMSQINNIGQQLYVEPMRRDDLAALLEKEDTLSDVQSQVYRKDGSVIWISENIRAVRDAQGAILHYEGTVSDITERRQAEVALRVARKKAELLLLNILPQPVAERLKRGQRTIAESFEEVTVLFADLVNFTKFSASTSPTELVQILNVIFSKFDRLAQRHGVEKIKTIGDAYMVVAGLPTPRSDHAQAIAEMALDMKAEIAEYNAETDGNFRLRIGINSGPVVAGVIGIKKFSYDLWGDTVNTASRMESHGIPGQIQVTTATYERLREQYLLEERHPLQVKGKGEMTTYLLTGRKL